MDEYINDVDKDFRLCINLGAIKEPEPPLADDNTI